MNELENLRNQIDQIDDEIKALYLKRMNLSAEVGKEKAKTGGSLSDPTREKKIVYRLTGDVSDDLKLYVKELYDTVFSTSKAYQNKFLNKTSAGAEKIMNITKSELLDFPVSATVACQGVFGANSGIAAEKIFPISETTYFKNFEGVFGAVEKGLCEFGILPIENSTAGSVSEVYDLMKKYRFSIVKSVRVRVEHCLVAVKGVSKKEIKTVVSHPQALLQCAEYLKNLGVKTVTAENTALAAKTLAESGDRTTACLCSERGAEAYGLEILEKGVQDSDSNFTRFICITKDLRIYKGADKISVMTSLAHTPGSLNRILSSFYALGLNLTKIESRPFGSGFEFMFYFDFEGDITDPSVVGLIADLENGSDNFVFLGSYKENV